MVENLNQEWQQTSDVVVERPRTLRNVSIVCGAMGGSAAAAQALGLVLPARHVFVHEGYDTPSTSASSDSTVYVAVSYSGDTEETLSFAQAALAESLPLAVVTSGGKLLEFAREHGLPTALVPKGLVPRNALPQLLQSLLALFDERDVLTRLNEMQFDEQFIEESVARAISVIENRVPVLYASNTNELLVRIGKMYLNEGAKIPAFASVLPARNHDELQGFTEEFASRYGFIFFYGGDESRCARRLDVLADMYRETGYELCSLVLPEDALTRLMSSWVIVRLIATRLAEIRGIDPNSNPITTEFKKRL